MNINKYFWPLNPRALKKLKRDLKEPRQPKFIERAYAFLSRSDKPKEVFSVISRRVFVENWPRLRRYWVKRGQAADFRAWWETIYEQLLQAGKSVKGPKGDAAKIFLKIGLAIRAKRLKMKISQSDFARQAGMKQPDISAIESGRKNVTLETLARLCRILKLKSLPFA